ncbi:uncharacterized protein LOC142563568 [Dermacentor variabilis]|uniref:uncharacterized protein LOC142563568 n=1 Tax=Dermacentor variabilis TaxID=34621 RepID=UPI003F5BEEDA
MISQMEAVADALSERRFNLRNELRTLQDENVHLQGALAHERRKFQARNRGGPVLHGGRGIPLSPPLPPPLPPRRDSVALYSPARAVLCSPMLTRYRPLSDNESSLIDLMNDGIASSASSSRVAASVASGPGPSAAARRGRGVSRAWRGGSNTTGTMTGLRRSGGSTKRSRGSANRSRVRRPPRTSPSGCENNGRSSSPVIVAAPGGTLTISTQDSTPPPTSTPEAGRDGPDQNN